MRKFLSGCLLAVGLMTAQMAPPAGATENVLVCSPGAGVATYVTSCPFAENVAAAYSGGGWEYAYSPVTGGTYRMFCENGHAITLNQWPWSTSNASRCTGGTDAVVWVW